VKTCGVFRKRHTNNVVEIQRDAVDVADALCEFLKRYFDSRNHEIDDGEVAEAVCYWKDMKMLPHVINLLSKRNIRASVRFTQLRDSSSDREELEHQLHFEVQRLKESPVCWRAAGDGVYPVVAELENVYYYTVALITPDGPMRHYENKRIVGGDDLGGVNMRL
jgi:hypothetical protein